MRLFLVNVDQIERKIKSAKRRIKEYILDKIQDYVRKKLICHFWTPEQIAGKLKTYEEDLPYVSHEMIYSWIYKKEQKDEKLWKFLLRDKARRGLYQSKGKDSKQNLHA